jgi:hypothetical protein
LHVITKDQNRIGLVNGIDVSIHHADNSAWFCPVAFIFDERTGRMVNRWCPPRAARGLPMFSA